MKTVWLNGVILNGTREMQPILGRRIFVADGRIEKITEDTESTEGYRVIDLKGKYIMPGLINLHVHLPAGGKPKKKTSDPVKAVRLILSNPITRWIGKKICASYARTELLSGVTTIRTVGGVADFDTKVREEIAAGKCTGPRILASNMAISVPGGHMVDSLAYKAMEVSDMRKYVDEIAKDKPDLIKLMITGGVLDAKKEGEPGELKMQPDFVKAACDRAHEKGIPVAAHVESPEGMRVALENGVDTIEHGAMPDEEMIRLFKEKKAALIATLSPALPFALFDQSVSHVTDMEKTNGEIVFKGIIECAKRCRKEGIPVGLGTDTGCPYTTHYNMWRELFFYHKFCEVPCEEVLYMATLGNALIAGVADETGSIEVGKSADFVVTEGNPAEDLRVLRNPLMVVMRGRLFENPHVKKMEQVEKQLDRFL